MSRRLLIFTQSCFAWVGGLMICVGVTYAAVDPDLFDGRMTPPPPIESSEASGSEGASGDIEQIAGEGAGEASSESRDFSEIASVSIGDTVGGESSKSGASFESPRGSRDFDDVGQVGGGESVDRASSKSGATGGGSAGSSGVPPEESGGTGGSGGAGAPTERSFEDFGFGATGESNRTVEVNQSKSAGVSPPRSTSGAEPPETSTPNSGAGAGGSTPVTGTGSGDYGSNLPSGL